MGADFTYALVSMTPDKPTLTNFIKEMGYDDLTCFDNCWYSFDSIEDEEDNDKWGEQVIEILIGAVDAVFDSGSSREVGHLFINENHYLITGGMSWGDHPTDIYPDFEIVENLQNYYKEVTNENRTA